MENPDSAGTHPDAADQPPAPGACRGYILPSPAHDDARHAT
ncbi:MAG: hypothetical protein PUF51_06925 [Bifidobacteriaceae bacterium]|nr:hypothetical protein [Bifidobacteriaceae bacterium]